MLFSLVVTLNKFLWGLPLIVLLFSTHIYFTIHLHGIQKKTKKGILLSVQSEQTQNQASPIKKKNHSGFAALTTTLAATLGTGNIIGVSTAIFLGGPGAVFWCWLTGLLGMATTYAESYICLSYRRRQPDGSYTGGPMYALEDGLGKKGLGRFYAFLAVLASFGVGCFTQANAITEAVHEKWNFPPLFTGFLISGLIGCVLLGGISSLKTVCMRLVPAMGLFYFVGGFAVLICHYETIFPALSLIFTSAFSPLPIGSGILSHSIKQALHYGISRGLFTNEAGLGSAGIAAASADTSDIRRQSLISMTATFWDTVVMCALTGILIVSSFLSDPASIENCGAGFLAHAAFATLPFSFGRTFLHLSLIVFALATLLGWSYLGSQAFSYLFGKKKEKTYYLLYLLAILSGGLLPLTFVWECSDLVNALLALPNLYLLFRLRKKIKY